MSTIEKLLKGIEVEWKTLGEVFDITAGGDAPQKAFSKTVKKINTLRADIDKIIKETKA